MSVTFYLEIGSEEIPDWMIVPALNHLQDAFQRWLDANAVGGKVTKVDATPRRLVLRAEGLKARQEDATEVLMGPPKSAGEGAVRGFAKKTGRPSTSFRPRRPPKASTGRSSEPCPAATSDLLAKRCPA